jgi:exonuclease VII small subunit
MNRHSALCDERFLTVSVATTLMVLSPLIARAADDHKGADNDKAAALVPLSKIVMFSSGVGFFEHDGEVTGDTRVDLRFNVNDINDLLKSMVLQDFGGGKISTVNYESKDPITKTLKTFAIDLTTHPTLAELLKQIRGESVEIDAPQPISGKIIGVEHRKVRVGKDETTEVDFVNLLTAEGLRSISLESVSRIKLTNEKLNSELQQALAVLATGHDTDKKTVTLHFLGNGKREVQVGYVQESPVWKTSYRLVLDDNKPPFLQGWAIVENTTEQDWKNVDLTLVSGRPISFTMDLYQPLFVTRPVVVPELYAALRPQTYEQDLAARDAEFVRKSAAGPATADAAAADGRRLAAARAPATPPAVGEQGVESAAQAGAVGELFKYQIATPVTLPRHESAMLPIVNGAVEAKKVSIFNSSVEPKHPLNGLRFKNTTDLHLMQGPITVFDAGAYAGDAEIKDLAPNSERLVSYALDLDTEVASEAKSHPEELTSVRIAKGTLIASRKYRRTQTYTVKNSGHRVKDVLIEYPRDPNWNLVEPKQPAEKTRDQYRFAVKAEPGKPVTLSVEEDRTDHQQVALSNLDLGAIQYYVRASVVSSKVKDALAQVIKRRAAIDQLTAKRQQLEQQVHDIDTEQARIRQNMAQLDRGSDLYKRYVGKFAEQEDQIDTVRKQIRVLQAEEIDARKSLDDYLLGLDLD